MSTIMSSMEWGANTSISKGEKTNRALASSCSFATGVCPLPGAGSPATSSKERSGSRDGATRPPRMPREHAMEGGRRRAVEEEGGGPTRGEAAHSAAEEAGAVVRGGGWRGRPRGCRLQVAVLLLPEMREVGMGTDKPAEEEREGDHGMASLPACWRRGGPGRRSSRRHGAWCLLSPEEEEEAGGLFLFARRRRAAGEGGGGGGRRRTIAKAADEPDGRRTGGRSRSKRARWSQEREEHESPSDGSLYHVACIHRYRL